MTTRKVENPNKSGGSAFLWAVLAVLAIALLVIGIIVYNGQSDRKEAVEGELIDISGVNIEWTAGDSFITLTGPNADAPMGELFEDFSCSHCADLAVATDEEMTEALRAGDIRVELRPMVIQDRGAVGHSTNSLSAMLALISAGDDQVAFTLRDYLMQNQADVYMRLDNNQLADMAQGWGASKQAVADIRDAKFVETAQQMSIDNVAYQTELTGEAWTPRVLIDGKDAEDYGASRDEWVQTLKNSK